MKTLNTFNQSTEDHPKGYYFYLVDFKDIHSSQSYFRIIDCDAGATHAERMARFDRDLNGGEEPRYEVVRYELDMDEDEMLERGLREIVLHDTYWDRVVQGAV